MADEKKRSKFVVEEVVDEPETAPKEDKVVEEDTSVEAKEAVEKETQDPAPEETQAEETQKQEELPDESAQENKTEEVAGEVLPEKKTNFKLVIILTAFIALVLGGVVGGVLVFMSGVTPETVEEDLGPKPTATATPSAEPEVTEPVDRSEFTINIQNGSGIAGEGGRMSSLLTKEEFEVGTVGNASSYDYEETVIQAKEDVSEAFLSELEEVLGESYVLADQEELPTSASSDINIIVGSEKP